jgi:hypothetical protein
MISPTESTWQKSHFQKASLVSRGPGCEAVVQKSDTSVASVSSLLPAGLSEGLCLLCGHKCLKGFHRNLLPDLPFNTFSCLTMVQNVVE